LDAFDSIHQNYSNSLTCDATSMV